MPNYEATSEEESSDGDSSEAGGCGASDGDNSEASGCGADFSSGTWSYLPDNMLLGIFSCLQPPQLYNASQVSKQWNRVACDELLWKDLLYRCSSIDRSIPRAPGTTSWREEFKRLYYHVPMVESEVLREHRDQVLHVAFSNNGDMFSSCSKDGFVKVWNATCPVSLKCYADMKEYTWKYTQFSQFNETDTLLLVSGVHFGSNSTSGEIVVFNLIGGKFELQCRVLNKPYDVFGTWYNNDYLLSGNIHWLGNYSSCSALWLNKASQALECENESVVMQLYKFLNINASSVRTILISNCLTDSHTNNANCGAQPAKCVHQQKPEAIMEVQDHSEGQRSATEGRIEADSPLVECDGYHDNKSESMETGQVLDSSSLCQKCSGNTTVVDSSSHCAHHSTGGSTLRTSSIAKDSDSQQFPQSISSQSLVSACSVCSDSSYESAQPCQSCGASSNKKTELSDKYLIFTMGTKSYTPHQIGIKLIAAEAASRSIEDMLTRINLENLRNEHELHQRRVEARERAMEREAELVEDAEPMEGGGEEPEDENQPGRNEDEVFDEVDHLIELHGHIIGMCLSPDHRYLYVNSRPWPKGYVIEDPLTPPPIAQEIDIHVIDLLTMEEVGEMLRAHKAYTPNDECFFIFLDVCQDYVASGAENNQGYLWDRHYGVCLTRYSHEDAVNCVAFNPRDPETLITASDDHSIKIWRSHNRHKQMKKKLEARGNTKEQNSRAVFSVVPVEVKKN